MKKNKSVSLRPVAIAALCAFLAGCGGGGDSQSGASSGTGSTGPTGPGQAANYTIGGTLSGLSGGTLVLLDNNQDALTLTANGAFTFASPVAFNKPYSVAVKTNPQGQSCVVTNGDGTATANVSNVTVNCANGLAVVTTLAGSGAAGAADGAGTAASFNGPSGVAVDTGGNLYVADENNNEIRKITPAGVVTTLAGSITSGSADGTGAAASFGGPRGVAVDASGNVYVADTGNHEVRKITPAGVVTTLAGSTFTGTADGTGAAASFNDPSGVAVDASGNVYVADRDNDKIRKITPAGVVTTLAGSTGFGAADGTGAAASFDLPSGVAVDASGNVYVADYVNHEIRKITPAGMVTTLAGSTTSGAADGTGASASFNGPNDVAVDASGNVYVTDEGNNNIRKITPAGVVTTLAGSTTTPGAADGVGAEASFNAPTGVAVDASGNIYVADFSNNKIRKITPTPR